MTADDIRAFAKLIRLLASEHEGERSVAALKATKFLAARGYDWHHVVDLMLGQVKPVETPKSKTPDNPYQIDHADAASLCLTLFNYWTDREYEFLNDIQFYENITKRQADWLIKLYRRYLQEMGKI